MKRSSRLRALAEKRALDEMHEAIDDGALRAALTPDYPMGARRILFSDTYYPALAEHDHLDLVTTPIERISPTGVVTADGVEHGADVLILSTGFETTDYLTPVRVTTDAGRCLNDDWSNDGAEGYYGTAVSGYPNLFFLYGPNTNLGHSSIVFMMECQVRLVLALLRRCGRPSGRGHRRRTGRLQPRDATSPRRLGVGCRRGQLVSDRRQDHAELAGAHARVLATHPPTPPRRLRDADGFTRPSPAGRRPLASAP